MELSLAETYSLTVMAYKISAGTDGQDSGSSYCGTQTLDAGAENTPCVMSLTTTIHIAHLISATLNTCTHTLTS